MAGGIQAAAEQIGGQCRGIAHIGLQNHVAQNRFVLRLLLFGEQKLVEGIVNLGKLPCFFLKCQVDPVHQALQDLPQAVVAVVPQEVAEEANQQGAQVARMAGAHPGRGLFQGSRAGPGQLVMRDQVGHLLALRGIQQSALQLLRMDRRGVVLVDGGRFVGASDAGQ